MLPLLVRYKKLLVTPSLEFHPSTQFAEGFRQRLLLYRQQVTLCREPSFFTDYLE